MIDKVYVIFQGEYSDRGIDRIFTDEAQAKAYIYEFGPSGDCMDMEVWGFSDNRIIFKEGSIEKAKDTVKLGYIFCLLEDGTIKWESSYELLEDTDSIKGYFDYFGRFVKAVVAKGSSKEEYDRCLKVARDALAKAKAEKEGL